MTQEKYYAHTPNKNGEWHTLKDHLIGVAEKAREFARKFGAGDLAFVLGLWHDIGKSILAFLIYLKSCYEGKKTKGPHHAIWGAVIAYRVISKTGKDWEEIALPIAGHHTGLHQRGKLSQKITDKLSEAPELFKQILAYAQSLPPLPPISFPDFIQNQTGEKHRQLQREFLTKMLYSALVDADYLDTEKHFKPELHRLRGQFPSVKTLLSRFRENQEELMRDVKKTKINRIRKEVYRYCHDAASESPGIFQLTVPTGGGKTRSGLAFALGHAYEQKKERIIFAIPYTSIIDQTAREYRKILGSEAVLEHHSQVVLADNTDEIYDPERTARQMATENWDAPIIVTTTVQLFESIFANRPSKTRKLHNLSQSVIVLDEVQTLPPELLTPILDALRTLSENYGTTIVLCTATQPAFEKGRYQNPFQGLPVKEIIPREVCQKHFEELKRVEYEIRPEPVSWEDMACELREFPQVLVVVNTRKDALALVKLLKKDQPKDEQSLFHLSTLLCGAHRKMILAKIKKRLKKGLSVTLISTQVIEAGVDIDFPVVYRAIGPLDRIVQAAGRCNRENQLAKGRRGRMIVFEPSDGRTPKGPYKAGLEKAKLLLKDRDASELHNPELYELYFERLLAEIDQDQKDIQIFRENMDYPKVSKTFRLIGDDTRPVVVNCEIAKNRLKEWQKNPSRRTWQRLQLLIVNIFENDAMRLKTDGWIEKVTDNLYESFGKYDELIGVIHEISDPSDLILLGDEE